jgi:protease I
MPGSASLLCHNTALFASRKSSRRISDRRRKVVPVQKTSDSKVLIVATDGFEESELFGPRRILQDSGAEVLLASLTRDPIQATVHDDPGKTIRPDLTVDEADASAFDALVLPGGVRNPDALRGHANVITLIRDFAREGKPVAAICHGPWLLVEADLLRGRTATAWPSIRTDLRNAGANVVDQAAVTDGNIVTSRNPGDVEAFTNALVALIEKQSDPEQVARSTGIPA